MVPRRAKRRVREALLARRHDDACLTGWGRLGGLLRMIINLGVLRSPPEQGMNGGPVPQGHLLLAYFVKALTGCRAVSGLKDLFQDAGLVRLLGFSARQRDRGFSDRTRRSGRQPKGGHRQDGRLRPIHPETVRNLLKRLKVVQSLDVLRFLVRRLKRRGEIKPGLFALDSKYLWVRGKTYENAAWQRDPHDNQLKRGYKLCSMIYLGRRRNYVVAAMLVPANVAETTLLWPMIRQAVRTLGPKMIRTLLIDRGYLDGDTLYKMKHRHGIDFVIPLKKDLIVRKDAWGIVEAGLRPMRLLAPAKGQQRPIHGTGVEELRSYPSYSDDDGNCGPLGVAFLRDENKELGRAGVVWGYLTTLPVDDPLAVYRLYGRRWAIENNLYHELACHWHVGRFPSTSWRGVCAHVFLTLVAFNLVQAFKHDRGDYVGWTVYKLRREVWTFNAVLLFAGDLYAAATAAEALSLLGRGRQRASPT